METEVGKALLENAIGKLAVNYLETLRPDVIIPVMEARALALIAEIKVILDDETTEDPECFRRIDELVEAFHKSGIPTDRHDW